MVRFNVRRFAHCVIYMPKNECYAHRILYVAIGCARYVMTNTGEEFGRLSGLIAGGHGALTWHLTNHEIIWEMLTGTEPRPVINSYGVNDTPYNLFAQVWPPTSLDTSSRLTRVSLQNMMLRHKIQSDEMCHFPLDIPERPRLKSRLRERVAS